LSFDEVECLFAFFSRVFTLIIVPDCVIFNNSKFAFKDGIISYVYKHACESTDRVVSIKNGFDTELRVGFVGEGISICFRKLPAAIRLTTRSYVTCNLYGKVIASTEIGMSFSKKNLSIEMGHI